MLKQPRAQEILIEIAASTLYGVRVGNCVATYAYEMIGPLATWAGAALIAVNAYIECLNQ